MIDVTVMLLGDCFASSSIGPIEVFHSAGTLWNLLNGLAPQPRFRVTTATMHDGRVDSPHGVGLSAQATMREIESTDIVIVPAAGLSLDAQLERHTPLFAWLRHHATRGTYIAGVCSGAAYLAAAGLLDGREATSHWALVPELQRRYPAVKWRPDKLVTEDRRILCSGGVYASIDLSLYLVERFCGHEVAVQTAHSLVLDMPRASQASYAMLPLARPHDDAAVREAEGFIGRNYAQDIGIEQLAERLHMSPRNFMRRFKSATGHRPSSYLQATRVAVARQMLERGARSVQAVSAAVGYVDMAFFRALFKRTTGMTPAEYREHFASRGVPAARRRGRTTTSLPAHR